VILDAEIVHRPILINCGRGGLVDEAALVNALNEGQIAGAGIDYLTAEPPDPTNSLIKVLDRRDVIVTPHTAWASDEARGIVWDQVIEQIENYHRGEPGNRVV
jgi:glycerate dehydrogenase